MRSGKLRLALLSGFIVTAVLSVAACTSRTVGGVTPVQQNQVAMPTAHTTILQAATKDGRLNRLKAAVAQAVAHPKKTTKISSPAEGARLDPDIAQLIYVLWGVTKQTNEQEIQVLFAVAATASTSGATSRTTETLIDAGPGFMCIQYFGSGNDGESYVPLGDPVCGFFGQDDLIYIADSGDNGNGTGPGGGGPAPAATPCAPGALPSSIATQYASDNPAQALEQAVATRYGSPTQVVAPATPFPVAVAATATTPGTAGVAAEAHASQVKDANGNVIYQANTIAVSDTSVAAAVATAAQDPFQIFVEELLHLWYDTPPPGSNFYSNPHPGDPSFQATRTVTLDDGTIMTFNISATNGKLNGAYTGYEHALIFDYLVANYTSGKTGALGQAFLAADTVQLKDQTPQKMDAKTAFAEAAKRTTARITSGQLAKTPPTVPIAGKGCNTLASQARKAMSLEQFSDGYSVDWDGSLYWIASF
jgi:hypothetical protein